MGFPLLAATLLTTLAGTGCTVRLDFEECPATACADGLVCVDGGCVLPPDPGCLPPEPPVEGDAVVFGAVQNLSGEFNEVSLQHQQAMRLAVEHVNASGALGDRQLSMIWCDSRDDNATVADAIHHLVDAKNVPAVLGIESSSLMLEHGAYATDRATVLMSHWATAQAVTRFEQRPDGTTMVWRTSPSDRFQAQALASIVDKGCATPDRIGVLFLDDEYGRGLRDGLRAELCGQGGGPGGVPGAGECFQFTRPLPDVQAQGEGEERETEAETAARVEEDARLLVADVLQQRNFIDVLAIFGFQDHAAAVFKQLDEQGGADSGLTILVGEDVLSRAVLASEPVKRLGLTILGANPGLARGRSYRGFDRAWREAARSAGGGDDGPAPGARPPAFAAHAYDSVIVLALAAAATPPGVEIDGEALVEGLVRIADPEAETYVAGEMLEAATALRSGSDVTVNYEGASGDLDFDPAVGEAPGTSISPNLALPDGRVCPATNLLVGCANAAAPSCREPCSAPFPDLPDDDAERLLLGGLLSMSGPNLELGGSRRQAMELALDHLNSQDVGRPVQMILCDVETDVDLAVSRAEELVEEHGVPALIGPSSSAQSIDVGKLSAEAGVLMITPSATAANVTSGAPAGPGGERLVWRTCPSDSEQARALADFVVGAGCVERLGLVYRNDVYGNGLRSGFVANACPTGDCPFELIPQVLPEQGTDAAYAAVAEALTTASPGPDAILLLAFRGEGTSQIAALKAAGWTGPIIASETLVAPIVADDPAVEGLTVVGTNPGLSRGPAYNEFAIPYAAEFDNATPDTFAAASYDAVIMAGLAAATFDAGAAPTGARLSAGLARLSGGDTRFHPGELRAAASALSSSPAAKIDYDGASGRLDLDPATGEARAEVPLYVIRDGAFEPLAAEDLSAPLCP